MLKNQSSLLPSSPIDKNTKNNLKKKKREERKEKKPADLIQEKLPERKKFKSID